LETKECSSCLADVPFTALRCKHCFHDFTVQPRRNPGPMVLLWALAAMSIIGAVVMGVIVQTSSTEKYAVDWTTESVHSTKTTLTGSETSSIPFDDIDKIEYIEGGDSKYYEVVALTRRDQRLILMASDDQPLRSFATQTHLAINSRTSHDVELIETRDDPSGQ